MCQRPRELPDHADWSSRGISEDPHPGSEPLIAATDLVLRTLILWFAKHDMHLCSLICLGCGDKAGKHSARGAVSMFAALDCGFFLVCAMRAAQRLISTATMALEKP